MIKNLSLIVCLVGFCASAQKPNSDDEIRVQEIQLKLLKAIEDGDITKINSALTNDCKIIYLNGSTETKDEALLKLKLISHQDCLFNIYSYNVQVKSINHTIILAGKIVIENNDKRTDGKFINTYVAIKGEWKIDRIQIDF